MPDPAVTAVKALRIRRLQCQHHTRELRGASLDRQMDMVPHQIESQKPEAEPLAVFRQALEIPLPVPVIAKHRLALVAPNDDMVNRPLTLQPPTREVVRVPMDDEGSEIQAG